MDKFVLLLRAHGLPDPHVEFKFHPTRKWRFDYAWPAQMVAVESEGGAWIAGRHTRGKGFVADLEKYNAAVVAGWAVLRYTPQQLDAGDCLDVLKAVLA